LAAVLARATAKDDVAARLRVGGLSTALATPLARFGELLVYAEGVDALQMGRTDDADRLLGAMPDREIEFAGIRLKSPRRVLTGHIGREAPAVELSESAEQAEARTEAPAEMSSLADLPELVGFFSYSREDDEAVDGTLSALRDAIQRELSAQLGRSKTTFRLWQDQAAIAPGKLWETEIKKAVEQAVFFIPIITPRAVTSHHCKFEFEAFLARERALGRNDLVFPLLYIGVPVLEDEAQWRTDPILSIVGMRQYVDWRPLRHLDVRTPAVREQIEHFCDKIVEALLEPWVSPEGKSPNSPDPVAAEFPENQFTVFVARPASDGREPYLKIVQELQHLGYRTVPDPDGAIPEAGTEAKSWFQTSMDKAQLAVHLLTAGEGFRPEGASPIAELQLRLSADRAAADKRKKKAFRRVLWLPRSVSEAPLSEGYRQVLEALRQGGNEDISLFDLDECIEAEDFEKFRDEVINVVSAAAAPAARTSPRITTPVVYIMCAPGDFKRAQGEIESVLFDAGCDVRLPLRAGSEEDKRKDREKYLAENRYRTRGNAILLLWGRASEAWAREAIDQILLSGAPPHALGLLKLTPMTAAARKFRTHTMTVLDESAESVTTALQRFADQLKSAR
jgi:hypothetical protein